MPSGVQSNDLMSDAEVRLLLGVSRTTLWKLRKETDLPFGRAGRKYLYRRSEILLWVRNNQAHPVQQNGNGVSQVGPLPAAFQVSDNSGSYLTKTSQGTSESPEPEVRPGPTRVFYKTGLGEIILGNSLDALRSLPEHSVNLIMTSPPFGLVRKKAYGNEDADKYLDWFRPFGKAFKRVLKENGSLVIDLGGAWVPGQPTRSLYHLKLPILLCEEMGFHLAQEFYWWNPSKLPTPAEWVTVRRVRVKDAVNCVWWLSSSPWPKASNTRKTYHPERFYTLKIGVPWVDVQNKLSVHEVLALCGDHGILERSDRSCTMGVDTGKELHVVISRRKDPSGKVITREVVYIGTAQSYEELDSLMKQFQVSRCVIDAMPEIHATRQFATRHGGRVWMNYFNEAQKGSAKWDADQHIVQVNRTEALDASKKGVRDKALILPRRVPLIDTFAQHLASDAKKLVEDQETGSKFYRYVRAGTNHYSLAFTYDWLACEQERRPYVEWNLPDLDDDDRPLIWQMLKAMEHETGIRWDAPWPDKF